MKRKELINAICIFLIGLIIIIPFQTVILKMVYPKKNEEYVYKYSKENEIDPLLTFAIIKAESNFNDKATSKSGALGLMQIMPETAKEILQEMGEQFEDNKTLYNKEQNIKIGTKYYSYLYKRYNNINLALAAYNAGIGNVDEWIKEGIINKDGSNIEKIPYKETNNYVRKILRDYTIYKVLYNAE